MLLHADHVLQRLGALSLLVRLVQSTLLLPRLNMTQTLAHTALSVPCQPCVQKHASALFLSAITHLSYPDR
jgi:hypothetical protein